jgi:hypothetical protein
LTREYEKKLKKTLEAALSRKKLDKVLYEKKQNIKAQINTDFHK